MQSNEARWESVMCAEDRGERVKTRFQTVRSMSELARLSHNKLGASQRIGRSGRRDASQLAFNQHEAAKR